MTNLEAIRAILSDVSDTVNIVHLALDTHAAGDVSPLLSSAWIVNLQDVQHALGQVAEDIEQACS